MANRKKEDRTIGEFLTLLDSSVYFRNALRLGTFSLRKLLEHESISFEFTY